MPQDIEFITGAALLVLVIGGVILYNGGGLIGLAALAATIALILGFI